MKVTVNDIFKVAVFEVHLDRDVSALTKIALSQKENSPQGRKLSNQGGWQSDDIGLLGGEFDLLFQDLTILVSSVSGFLDYPSVTLENAWLNINGHMDFNWDHTHPGSTLSGVYYIKVPPNSGDIKFVNPAAEGTGQFRTSNFSSYNASTWSFKPEENVVYLFPSWLRHRVLPNLNTEQQRISLAFNCNQQ